MNTQTLSTIIQNIGRALSLIPRFFSTQYRIYTWNCTNPELPSWWYTSSHIPSTSQTTWNGPFLRNLTFMSTDARSFRTMCMALEQLLVYLFTQGYFKIPYKFKGNKTYSLDQFPTSTEVICQQKYHLQSTLTHKNNCGGKKNTHSCVADR